MSILVTAANGQLGTRVVENLLARGVPAETITAGARTPAKAEHLAARGVRVVHLDYDDQASIAAALEGIDRVLLISGADIGRRVEQHSRVIDAAKNAGVSFLAYTSAASATSDFSLLPEHRGTEEALRASGIPAAVLRNSWYVENYVGDAQQARETGVFIASVGEARVAAASRADYAEAAAIVLTTDGHEGAVYELAGDDALTYAQIADAMSTVLARPVQYRPLTSEQHAELLKEAGVPSDVVPIVTGLDADIAAGALDIDSADLSRLLGRPTTPFAEALRAAL